MMPAMSVTAKPWIGPVPNEYSTTPIRNVVMLPSAMAERAFSKPMSTAARMDLPDAELLADALVDEHVGVDGHAERQHDAGDAGQRQRGLEAGEDAEEQDRG